MKNTLTIAFFELKRMKKNHMLWFVLFSSTALLFLMDLFDYFAIEEQLKMIQDFSLGILNFSLLFLVLFYPAHLIQEEFQGKTIYTLLATSATRSNLLFGKVLALFALIGIAVGCNLLSLSLMLSLKGGVLSQNLLFAIVLIYLKNVLLIGFSLLFGLMPLSPVLCAILTFLVLCVGSVKSYFLKIVPLHPSETLQTIQTVLLAPFPNFHIFDVVDAITLGQSLPASHLLSCFSHFLGVSFLVYGAAILLFNRREL